MHWLCNNKFFRRKFDKFLYFEYNWTVVFGFTSIYKQNMKKPDHYKNLDPDQKRVVVANLISQFWNKEIQDQINRFTNEQINFLFTYFFTESREQRERMWYDMQTEYESTLREIEYIADKIQQLNIKYNEVINEGIAKKPSKKK